MGHESFQSASSSGGDVTLILQAAQNGDAKAAEELLPLVYANGVPKKDVCCVGRTQCSLHRAILHEPDPMD